MANSVDPDQTAPIGAVCSGSMLFASILNSSVIAADDISRQHFQMHFFLGALLRVKTIERKGRKEKEPEKSEKKECCPFICIYY